jgi:hypothetical protein
VATMLYILALQEVTPCPFRVVDEINQVRSLRCCWHCLPLPWSSMACRWCVVQGMDRYNERLMFERLMETCSRPMDSKCTCSAGSAWVSCCTGTLLASVVKRSVRGCCACGAVGRQYFVISPKLLPSLALSACVRVHTVMSGSFVNKVSVESALRAVREGRSVWPSIPRHAMPPKRLHASARAAAGSGSDDDDNPRPHKRLEMA